MTVDIAGLPEPPLETTAAQAAHGSRRRWNRFGVWAPGLFFVGLLVCIVLVDNFWPYGHDDVTDVINQPPSWAHPLGTDALGHDMFGRTMHAAGQSVMIALVVTLVGMSVGVAFGVLSGYFGGATDTAIMRITDLAMTIPLIAIAGFLANLGLDLPGPGWLHMGLILAVVIWTLPARLVRGVTMRIRVEEFIEVARSYRVGPFSIIRSHILPNAIGQILVTAAIMLAVAILAESGLSFIGLGVQPPEISLGVLVAQGQASAFTSPWLFYPAGLLIVGVALAANFLADAVRGIVDPRSADVGAVGIDRVRNRAAAGSGTDHGTPRTGAVTRASATDGQPPALLVRNLSVRLKNGDHLVRDVSFELGQGQCIAIVGESGAGKSTLANALVGALPRTISTTGSATLGQTELLGRSFKFLRNIRGAKIGFIQQDPMTFLNPVMRIEDQIREGMRSRERGRSREVMEGWLHTVGIRNPRSCLRAFPHELSGGMKQRIGIVMALQNGPSIVIADEPTTALDATIQADVVKVLKERIRDAGASLLFVTHNLGLVAGLADRVIVMYGGQVVETGSVDDIFYRPRMPYTVALLSSVPRIDRPGAPLTSIAGQAEGSSSLAGRPECVFLSRCPRRFDRCESAPPLVTLGGGHQAACWLADPEARSEADVGGSATAHTSAGDAREGECGG